MKFEDPRRYLDAPYFTGYALQLHKEYAPLIVDMFKKLGYFKCDLRIGLNGPVFENRILQNGIYYPPSVICVYLFNCIVTAYDNCVELNRTDIDTVMRATLAYTLIHEISHSQQNTFVPGALIPAMEYANDQNIWRNIVPQLELILKRNYKVDIYHDRVDRYVGKVFSFPYSPMDAYDKVIYALLVNGFTQNSTPTYQEMIRINGMADELKDIPNIKITITNAINGMIVDGFIKRNGVVDWNIVNAAINLFTTIPIVIRISGDMGDLDENSYFITMKIDRPTNYNPIKYEDGTDM